MLVKILLYPVGEKKWLCTFFLQHKDNLGSGLFLLTTNILGQCYLTGISVIITLSE